MKIKNVLSLFDGCSCGQMALERAGIEVENYYSSEIDKYAIKITQKNYPKTIQLGDIQHWKYWNIDFSNIDLILAGFPCQSWSVSGKQKGDNDPRGALVHTLIELWNEVKRFNPNVKFLFENVKMKKSFIEYIDKLFGVKSIMIDSSLVSAQRRHRLYWTNIPNVTQPEDKGILLKDIIEHGKVDRDKSYCLDANYFNGVKLDYYLTKCRRQIVFNYSSSGRGNGKVEYRYYEADKSHTLTATGYSKRSFTGVYSDEGIRKLTPTECERLQTVDLGYTEGVSNSQRYKMLGNGWTVDVIAHIIKGLK